jgi:ATP phosphoribosyltransferase
LGLSGRIVDLVSSGQTLKENGLVETETVAQVSARLIVNRAAYKMMSGTIPAMVERFRELAK